MEVIFIYLIYIRTFDDKIPYRWIIRLCPRHSPLIVRAERPHLLRTEQDEDLKDPGSSEEHNYQRSLGVQLPRSRG